MKEEAKERGKPRTMWERRGPGTPFPSSQATMFCYGICYPLSGLNNRNSFLTVLEVAVGDVGACMSGPRESPLSGLQTGPSHCGLKSVHQEGPRESTLSSYYKATNPI